MTSLPMAAPDQAAVLVAALPEAQAVAAPVAAALALYAILRSMVLTLARGGIDWRGTRYPLKELRRQAGSWR